MAQSKSSAGSHNAHPYAQRQRLARLEERYRHELMDDEERQGLRDRIHRLRRHLGS
jgi:hypothetical protein